MKHELVQLAGKIDWDFIDAEIAPLYSDKGRPGIQTRFVIGLLLLKHIYGLSDEGVCERCSTISPPFDSRANMSMACSIAAASRTAAAVNCTLKDGATASIARHIPACGICSGLRRTATRVTGARPP